MELEKQIIKTYSRRQPVTRYESRAVLVPSYGDPMHVRESRLNDKTLVVDNFDDTFDRLTTGVVIPSGENSLGENEVANKKDSDIFEVFKMPMQTKKKPKQKGKPKKKDLVSKSSVKRKKVDVDSDDSGSSDQEGNHKKQSDNKKSKEKVKRVVKRKKGLSPVKAVTNDELVVSESTDENVPNNIESNNRDRTETNDNFEKPKEGSNIDQHKIVQYFQASTPRVNRIHHNIDMQNISPVVMEKHKEKEKKSVSLLSIQEIQAEFAASDEHGASENAECSQNNGTNITDNFAQPRESTKVHQLKTSSNLLTSTPRISRTCMPVNIQNLSPIISEKKKRVSGGSNEKSSVVDTNSNENCEVESNFNDDVQVPSDQVAEVVESPTKLEEIQHNDIENDCSIQNYVEGSEAPLSERTSASQLNQQELLVSSDVINKNDNQDEKTDGNDSLESMADDQDDTLVAAVGIKSSTKQQLNPTVNEDLHAITRSFVQSPLLFDDSECIQIQVDKSNVVSEIVKEDTIKINFSRAPPQKIEENNKESVNLESTNAMPATNKDKNFDVSTESSFYPHDWSNDYDSTYGYDQLKQNLEKDVTIDSKLDEGEDKNSIICSEKTNNTSAANVTEINEVSNLDNTEMQSVKNNEQDGTDCTIYDEDNNAIENSKNESDAQEKSHKDVNAPSISSENNHDLMNATEDSKNESHAQEESHEDVDVSSISSENNYDLMNATEDSKNESHAQEESHKDVDASGISSEDSINSENETLQNSQIIIEKKQSQYADENESFILELDESIAQPGNQDSDDESLTSSRPSKRRKTDTSEIMIFNKVEDNHASMQNEEDIFDKSDKSSDECISTSKDASDEKVNTESANDTSLVNPVRQYEEIIEKTEGKELRIVLERINYEEYKSPILSRRKSVKRKAAKRVSRKSKNTDSEFVPKKTRPRKSEETDSEFIPKKTKPEKTTQSNVLRVTRRSITENKMKQLYVQYQCKEVVIFAKRLENEKIDLLSRRSLKPKSRENSITEDDELDSSLTNRGLSEFLSKLNDPMKVKARRKTHKKYDGHLAAITEDQANKYSQDEVGRKTVTWGNDKRFTFNDSREENSEDTEDVNDRKSQPIFLKPGKSWARSLSIINHFHNGKNLDELAAGRENWRHSVQTILNMQPEASARSSSQNHEETRQESRASRASSQRGSKSMRKSSIAANSRFSIRIIPSGKRSTLTDDLLDSQRISYVSDRSRVSRKTSLKIRRDTLIETEDDLIKSAKDIILKRCKQTSYEPFDVCFPDSYIDNCRKIGEGVYGEVFLYEDGSEKSVIKIIPIEGEQLVNCEPQKKFHEILSEIIIAEELHKLRFDSEFHTNGFVEVNRIMCVIGKYPQKLIDLWYAYDEQKQSENDCPSMFEEDQLYIILELAHGGQDLEAYTFQNASESYTIFLQTALTLAVAEQSLEFEHRDLHWGNLLISKTEDKHSTYKLGSEEISLPTKGVKVAVIDFTLSRMSYQGCKIFNDLAADPTLFEAQGEYQFDIYRMMRDNVNDDWQQFNPFTNVLWMDYTLEKMITAVRYKRKTTKIHKSAIDDMKTLRKEIMNYTSAFDFVTNCKKVQALFDST